MKGDPGLILAPVLALFIAVTSAAIGSCAPKPAPSSPAAPAPGPDWISVLKSAGMAGLRALVCPATPAPAPEPETP